MPSAPRVEVRYTGTVDQASFDRRRRLHCFGREPQLSGATQAATWFYPVIQHGEGICDRCERIRPLGQLEQIGTDDLYYLPVYGCLGQCDP
jgi:hypothetical protein